MAELRTRPPTGVPAMPLIALHGGPKSGRSVVAYKISASRYVGRTFLLDKGEGTGDEYAALGNYEILVHDGTFASMYDQIDAACDVPREDGKPTVIIIDDDTAVWDGLKAWGSHRLARSKKGREALADDPDAELDLPFSSWNPIKNRWAKLHNRIRLSGTLGILIMRGDTVALVENGVPVLRGGKPVTTYSLQAEKNILGLTTVDLYMPDVTTAPRKDWYRPVLRSVRALPGRIDIPEGGLVIDADNPIEHVVFDLMGAAKGWQVSSAVPNVYATVERGVVKGKVRDLVINARPDGDRDQWLTEAGNLWRDAERDLGGGEPFGEEISEETEVEILAFVKSKLQPSEVEAEVAEPVVEAAPALTPEDIAAINDFAELWEGLDELNQTLLLGWANAEQLPVDITAIDGPTAARLLDAAVTLGMTGVTAETS